MHPDTVRQRFRIVLHILKRLDRSGSLETPNQSELETDGTQYGGAQENWLGHETMLFKAAITAIAALERHLNALPVAGTALNPEKPLQARSIHSNPWCDPGRLSWPGGVQVSCLSPGGSANRPWVGLESSQAIYLHTLIEGLVAAFLQNETDYPSQPPVQPGVIPSSMA
ncbi:MAG TPA: hypothetical protein VNV60_12260 [Holophagaceae bacterium]|nr:hypothetical protein [Holophagaceae bacterium]